MDHRSVLASDPPAPPFPSDQPYDSKLSKHMLHHLQAFPEGVIIPNLQIANVTEICDTIM
jgi:hypothetical protein